jgi:hypothetical protein
MLTPVRSVTASAIAAAICPDPPAGPYGTIMVNARLGYPEGLAMLLCLTLHSNAPTELARKKLSMPAKPNTVNLLRYILFIVPLF